MADQSQRRVGSEKGGVEEWGSAKALGQQRLSGMQRATAHSLEEEGKKKNHMVTSASPASPFCGHDTPDYIILDSDTDSPVCCIFKIPAFIFS